MCIKHSATNGWLVEMVRTGSQVRFGVAVHILWIHVLLLFCMYSPIEW